MHPLAVCFLAGTLALTAGCRQQPSPLGPPPTPAPSPNVPDNGPAPKGFGAVRTVNSVGEAAAAIDSAEVVVVCVSASWCYACKELEPHYREAAKDMKDVLFLKVDGHENPEVKRHFQVTAYPTLILLNRRAEAARSEGSQTARQLERWIRSNSRR